MRAALPAVDAAVVVCEMDEKKVPQLQLILRELEEQKIPRFLFLNKIDKADSTIHDALALLQPASRFKLLLRQIPTFAGDIVTGFVDLALERAFVYKEHAASEIVPLEGDIVDGEDRALLHAGDAGGPRRRADGAVARRHRAAEGQGVRRPGKELRDGLVCPVLMGAATRTNGVLRLMKALRHEAPDIATTVKRLGVKAGSDPIAYVLKTLHTAHGGKMSVARILNGQVGDGTTFQTPEREAGRVAGVFKLMGQTTEKRGPAQIGETVALAKLDHATDRRYADRRQAGACSAA